MKIVGLLALHIICIFYLWYLWKDKNRANQRGTVLTKMGLVSRRQSPRLFRFSVWVDFVILLILYGVVIAYSIILFTK